MRTIGLLGLVCLLAGGAMAQRGGGGHGGGGGGMHGGGGFGGGHSGGMGGGGMSGGGMRGGGYGGGGFGGGGYSHGGGYSTGGYRGYGGYYGYGRGYYGYGRGYYGYGSRYAIGIGFGYGGYYPGYGIGYWPGYYDYGYASYDPYYYGGYYGTGYASGYGGGSGYAPATTAVYQPQQPASTTVVIEQPVRPMTHVYDEYGQEIQTGGGSASTGSTSSPIYLIAFHDQVIRVATSYHVQGNDLIYVTSQHEEKRVPLSSIDRNMTLQLNRERHVQMQLPQ